jgi:energy-coupling factor transport system ATP-binding protein
MIRFEHVTITYADAAAPTLRDVDFAIPAGELCVVIGATGSGKTTLLGAINGLVPEVSYEAGSRSTVATRARIHRASSPMSSAS